MSDGRKKLSGSEYKKRAKEKNARIEAVLQQTPSITNFFNITGAFESRNSANTDTTTSTEDSNQSKSTDKHIEQDNPDDKVETNTNTKTSDPHSPATTTSTSVSTGSIALPLLTINSDPAEWIINDNLREFVSIHGINQNLNEDFTCTRRQYPDKVRFLNKSIFNRTLSNGEVQARPWLIFSKSKGCVFCAACRLFAENSSKCQLASTGYSDWKNGSQALKEHENSLCHRSSSLHLLQRATVNERLDKQIVIQTEKEIDYWRSVLKRVVATVRSLVIRGLPLRGDKERFGSLHSGNFIMTLELLAEFDSFLAEHIRRYGNIGSGKTSYLSSKTCDEFINIMADAVTKKIVKEIKEAKYFSISVDSTPDMSHIDQLSFVVRYVSKDGTPVERFLTFIPNSGHKSEELAAIVLNTLKDYDLDILNCRSQSYDNASNMSGRYTGLQARIQQVNPLVTYVPCAAHSLNLVGTCAAECCQISITFFGFVQELYNFFTASTHRWLILQTHLNKNSKTLKNLSKTRWSARNEACQSLSFSCNEIKSALESIAGDDNEKPKTRSDANSILKQFDSLEIAFMAVFWTDILNRLDAVNKKLQMVDIDLQLAADLYKSLEHYFSEIRDNKYENYEKKAMDLFGQKEYSADKKRKVKRNRKFDESSDNETKFDGRYSFRINVYNVIVDKLIVEISRRREAYDEFSNKFDFISNLCTSSIDIINDKCRSLLACYPNDLDESMINELIHFREFIKTCLNSPKPSARELLKAIYDKHVQDLFPNTFITLRILLCTFITNCSAERSFSALKRIKTYLRSTMENERLNYLAILHIESELLRNINYDEVIDDFANKKVRRKCL